MAGHVHDAGMVSDLFATSELLTSNYRPLYNIGGQQLLSRSVLISVIGRHYIVYAHMYFRANLLLKVIFLFIHIWNIGVMRKKKGLHFFSNS